MAANSRAVRRGLGAVSRILDDLRAMGGLRGADIANIVHVSPPTVSRWSHGKGTPPLRTQTIIADLRYVVDGLSDVYTPEETRLWLRARHPLLGNHRAIDLVHEGRAEDSGGHRAPRRRRLFVADDAERAAGA